MNRLCLLVVLAAVILSTFSASTALADIPLSTSFQRQVPSYVNVGTFKQGVNEVLTTDYDGGGARDLVFNNSGCIAVYSVVRDSVLFYFNKSGGVAAEGYLDADSSWDVVNCRVTRDGSNVCVIAVVYLSTNNWEPSDTIPIACYTFDSSRTVTVAALRDLDEDGSMELYVAHAYYWHDEEPIGGYSQTVQVSTRVRYSFVDASLDSVDYFPLSSYESYDLFPGQPPLYLLSSFASTDGRRTGYVYSHRSTSSIVFFSGILKFATDRFMCIPYCVCSQHCWERNDAVINGYVLGDFRPEIPGPEMLVSVTRDGSAVSDYDGSTTCRIRGSEFIVYNLTAEGTLDTLDVVSVAPERQLGRLAVSSDFPDYYMTVENRRIMTLDRNTYDPVDSSVQLDSAVGAGCEFVALQPLVDDGPEYLVLRSGRTFHFLTLEQLIPDDTIPDPDTTITPDPDTLVTPEPQPPLLPATFAVGEPFPNPFNPTVSIPVELPTDTRLSMTVFDIMGRRVEKIERGTASAGETTVTWDASAFPSGVYFIRITAGSEEQTVKAVLLK